MRYWEIDVARGVAVLLMICYHIILDLLFPYHSSFHLMVLFIASLFILVSGISLGISYSRGATYKKFMKRGLKLLFFGLIITAVSMFLLDSGFILFGILHFFGVTSFLIYPFLKHSHKRVIIFFGVLSILIGKVFLESMSSSYYLIWLGLRPVKFFTFDYFPIFPWFGVLLIGSHIGSLLYPNGKRRFKIRTPTDKVSKILQFFGKNSLLIYFLHQPIILLILYLLWKPEILSFLNV